MKAASVKEIKSALETLPEDELVNLCLRLIKFKKENKELATYVLFDESDESAYIRSVESSLSLLFEDVHPTNPYFAKKTIRKILRVAARYIRYSNHDSTGVEVLLFVATRLNDLDPQLKKSKALENIYLGLISKIKKLTASLHEDLQYDYLQQLKLIAQPK